MNAVEANLTLFLPAQELSQETAFFSICAELGGAAVVVSLLPNLSARLSATLNGAVYVETTTSHPLPVNKLFVLALVVAGGASSTKARVHVDDVVAAKVRQDKPATALLDPLESHVIKLNRGPDGDGGIRMGIVEFVVASKELPAVERATSLTYYRENARRVGHLTWFEPDGHGFQHPGAESLKLAPGVQAIPIPELAARARP
jgi:hypothetical protein